MKIRKNQKNLTAAEWDDFVCAYTRLQKGMLNGGAKPSLDDFADDHATAFQKQNHTWEVHAHEPWIMPQHWGLMFLPWHRVFLNAFENRLRREVAGVTIPYWNACKDPFPEELKDISANEKTSVAILHSHLPSFSEPDFEMFQFDLEVQYHNDVQAELRRAMGRRLSPRDVAFWLHHACIDRQWGHWFAKHHGSTALAMNKLIRDGEIVSGTRVRDVLHTTQLGYVYDNGIYATIEQHGSDRFTADLEQGMILCAKLSANVYAKLHVNTLSNVAACITVQQFPDCTPGAKLSVCLSDTLYCDLTTGRLDVAQEQAHIRVIKQCVGERCRYVIETINRTQLAAFQGITDFTANKGAGATDFDMLCL